jgi:hypothetical protein
MIRTAEPRRLVTTLPGLVSAALMSWTGNKEGPPDSFQLMFT